MRGKASFYSLVDSGAGITPAYAGKSFNQCIDLCISQDHPRLCGEKSMLSPKLSLYTGSPPPMRGKVQHERAGGLCRGITPAYAGKSRWSDYTACKVPGSPPPMRGKDKHFSDSWELAGITPAYAGKRYAAWDGIFDTEDHPRLCGEKSLLTLLRKRQVGSPPPMRGKGIRSLLRPPIARITPAYAGKSVQAGYSGRRIRDHPRLCGEKTKKIPKQRYFFHQPASFSFSLQYT